MTSSNPNDPESAFPVPEMHDKGAVTDADNGNGSFPIVGIGASAGGLEAYQQLLTHLPDDTGMAFVLIQHLDPHHESRLVDLLARFTQMPVSEAAHGQKVEPNHVYIIPPNVNLAIVEGKASSIAARRDPRAPSAHRFFLSLTGGRPKDLCRGHRFIRHRIRRRPRGLRDQGDGRHHLRARRALGQV